MVTSLPDCKRETGEGHQCEVEVNKNIVCCRFYYDSAANPGKFSKEQLVEIRKTSLSRIHCDNGDHVKLMQPLGFRKPSQMYDQVMI